MSPYHFPHVIVKQGAAAGRDDQSMFQRQFMDEPPLQLAETRLHLDGEKSAV